MFYNVDWFLAAVSYFDGRRSTRNLPPLFLILHRIFWQLGGAHSSILVGTTGNIHGFAIVYMGFPDRRTASLSRWISAAR